MAKEAEEHALPLALVLTTGSPEATVEVAAEGDAPSERQLATIHTERARRQTMSALYAELGALLPNLSRQASKTQVVEEAIEYVKALQDTAAELEAYRAVAAGRNRAAKRDGDGGDGAEVVASGETTFFAIRLRAARPGAVTRVLEVFQRHGAAVLAATVSRNGGEAAVTVTTAAVALVVAEKIKADIISDA